MSRGTASASVVLEFSVIEGDRRVRYRAGWSLRRARGKVDGNVQAATRELQRQAEDGQWEMLVQGTRASDAIAAFSDALQGLNAEDFQRCVLLAQGRFDALLSASPADRKSILERVVDVDRYRRIGEEVAARYKAARDHYDTIRMRLQLGEGELMDEESRVATSAQRVAIETKLSSLRATLSALDARIHWGRELAALEEALSHATREELAKAEECRARDEDRRALDLHDRLDPAIAIDEELLGLDAKCVSGRANVAQLEKEHGTLTAEMASATGALQDAVAAHEAAVKAQDEAEPELVAAGRAWENRTLARERLNACQKEDEGLRQELLALQQGILALQKEEASSVAQHAAALKRRDDLDVDPRLVASSAALGEQLARLRPSWGELRGALHARDEWDDAFGKATERERALREELERAREALAGIDETLVGYAGTPGASPGDVVPAMELEIQQLHDALRALTSLREAREKQDASEAAVTLAEATYREADVAWSDASRVLQEAQERLKSAEESVRERRELVATAREFLRYASELNDDEPCPLCGSEVHEASSHREGELRSQVERLDEALSQSKQALAVCESARDAAQISVDSCRSARASEETRLALARRALDEAAEVVVTRCGAVDGASPELDVATLAQRIEALEARREAVGTRLQDARKLVERRQHLAEDAAARRASAESQTKVRAELEARKTAVVEACEHGRDAVLAALKAIDALVGQETVDAVRGATDEELLAHAEEAGRALNALVARLAEHHNATHKVELCASALASVKTRTQELSLRVSAQEALVAASAQRHKDAQAALAREDDAVQRFFEGREPNAVRRALQERAQVALSSREAAQRRRDEAQERLARSESSLRECRAALATQQERAESLLARLQALLESFGVADRGALRASRLDAVKASSLREVLSSMDEALRELRTRLTLAAERLELHRAAPPAGGPPTEASADERAALQAEESAQVQALAELTAALRQDEERRARIEGARDELELASSDLSRWESVHQIAGVNGGDRFVELALALCMGELVQYANLNLKMLSSRYELRQLMLGSVPQLDFEIADHEQGGVVRPTSTLSGGERFILSLALALGLGNTVRSKLRFETLMIDEGFGTLDSDTLRKVIATLGDLQLSTGAQVMLISHVEMLSERIPARIYVRKLGGGRSSLESSSS